jgi:formylglycine-generating enzyme required for sulfatase activity
MRIFVLILLAGLLAVAAAAAPSPQPVGMTTIPAGAFTMGVGSRPPEGPARQVWLPKYFIDTTEVTVATYRACSEAGTCRWNPAATSPVLFRDDQPMVLVSWSEADEFCRFAGKRLPTEAEWEKAARGRDERKYPWGEKYVAGYANLVDAAEASVDLAEYRFTWPVGAAEKDVSPYGVRDLAGNVNEWTADVFADDYHRTTSTRRPQVPADGDDPEGRLQRTVRGGSFADWPDAARLTRRDGQRHAAGRGLRVGFRCVKDAL